MLSFRYIFHFYCFKCDFNLFLNVALTCLSQGLPGLKTRKGVQEEAKNFSLCREPSRRESFQSLRRRVKVGSGAALIGVGGHEAVV